MKRFLAAAAITLAAMPAFASNDDIVKVKSSADVATTMDRLEADPEWQARTAAVATAEKTAAAAGEKASQAEADRDEKRKPYDADPLFTYLWERGYGTSAYRAGPIARFFDAKVARLVGYDTARPNYHMLNEIPLRLRQHADRLDQAVNEARAALEAYERQGLEADGIVALEADMQAAGEAHDKAEAAIDGIEAKLAALDDQQAALLDPARDASLATALDGLSEAISRETLSALYKEAMATPTPGTVLVSGKGVRIEAIGKSSSAPMMRSARWLVTGRIRGVARRSIQPTYFSARESTLEKAGMANRRL